MANSKKPVPVEVKDSDRRFVVAHGRVLIDAEDTRNVGDPIADVEVGGAKVAARLVEEGTLKVREQKPTEPVAPVTPPTTTAE